MYTTSVSTAEDEPPEKSTSYGRLLFLSAVLISPAFLHGLNMSFPTVAMSLLDLSVDVASWLSSVAIYVSPVSSILAGIIIDKYGRKTALVYGMLPSLAGWSLLLWNYNTTVLLAGQMLNGLTIGALLYPLQVYAGECVMVHHPRLRNVCMVQIGLFSSLGTFAIVALYTVLDYYELCRVALAAAVALLAAFWLVIPESAVWLRLRGRVGDAEWSEKKLGIRQPLVRARGDRTSPASLPSTSSTASTGHIPRNPIVRHLRLVVRPDVYKPLLIMSVNGVLMAFCGKLTVTTYMITIIGDTIPGQHARTPTNAFVSVVVDGDDHHYALVCAAFTVLGSLTSTFVLPLAGMKRVFIALNATATAAMCALTVAATPLLAAQHAFGLRLVAVCTIAFLLGVGTGASLTAIGDMFPVDGKGFACVPIIVSNVSSATSNKLFPYAYSTLGGYAYCVYAFGNVLAAVYTYVWLPEVVGRTLNDINDEFWTTKGKSLNR